MRSYKKNDPSEQFLLWVAAVIFLFYSCYFIYQKNWLTVFNEEKIVEKEIIYFDYGTITDNRYCNDLFGFRVRIPNGYSSNLKELDYVQDSIPAAPRPISIIADHNLLIIEPDFIEKDPIKMVVNEEMNIEDISEYMSTKRQREQFGAEYQMVIRVHQLSGASLGSYIHSFENMHNPNYGNKRNKTISGVVFQEQHGLEQHGNDSPSRVMFRMLGGKNRNIISLSTVMHDFAFSIDLFYQTEEQKCTLLEIVDTITFH